MLLSLPSTILLAVLTFNQFILFDTHYIWEVLMMVDSTKHKLPYFFADRQSIESHELIVVDKDLNIDFEETQDLPDPMFRGFRYIRVQARDAHRLSWDLVLHDDRMLEDWKVSRVGPREVRRPDWPRQ